MEENIAFAEELEEVALQLSSLNPQPEDPGEIARTTASAVAEYERLSLTAAMFNMEGVQQTVDWIGGMLANFQSTLPEAILELLQGRQLFTWLELTAIALREPEEISHLPALTAEFVNDAWPEAPAPELLEKLLINLRTQSTPTAVSEKEPETEEAPRNPLAWDSDVHPELLAAYMQETPEQIAETARLIHLIAKGAYTAEQKRHAARLAHTVKGASGVVGVEAIATFTHRLEDILEFDIAPHLPHGLGATLEAAADCLETLFDNLQESKPLPDEYPVLLAQMAEWELRLQEEQPAQEFSTKAETDEDLPPSEPETLPVFITQAWLVDDTPEPADTQSAEPSRNISPHLSVPLETVQRLLNLAGELITSTSQIAEATQHTLAFSKQLQQQDEHIRQMLDELSETIDQQSASFKPWSADSHSGKQAVGDADFDQLELEAYNDLYSATNLLTESTADNRELMRGLNQHVRQISEQLYQQQRLQRQLSETILRTRLIPVQSIIPRMERTVRETCRRTGKQAGISFHGQSLQIDTDILQSLAAPLLHMLRNAVDHGIEAPAERKAAGKPEEGCIELHFEQKGSQIHMTLSDDGSGLDRERIRTRAIRQGVIAPEQELSEEENLRLILRPGFTTREEVSEISGRGVGMDVVLSAVENLQGLLHLDSTPGQGTRIHIQVPLTLIATNALLVRAGGNLIAIPSNTIQQLLYVSPSENLRENGQWCVYHQDHKLPVLQLAHLLGWAGKPPDLSHGQPLLIVKSEHTQYALYAEEILQPRDIVAKNLAPWINLNRGISGACILANGAVAPVLDTLRLLRNFQSGVLKPDQLPTHKHNSNTQQTHILIVDDSLSNRKSLALMVEQMGYHPVTAVDGLDALQHLHEHPIALVLSDLEMPRMNGLEMTQAIRIWPEKLHVPIIMITSRSTQKHRRMAQQAGVDDYLTKPISRDTLHTQLNKWLRTQLATA